MDELYSWADGLRSLKASDTEEAPHFTVHMHRISVPSPLDFDGSVVRVVSTGGGIGIFGQYPQSESVLVWPDSRLSSDTGYARAVATQLGAIMTMALDRRCQIGSNEVAMSMDGSEIQNFIPAQVSDRELVGPVPTESQALLEKTLTRVLGLKDEDRATLGAALELHYAAVILYDSDLNAAYALAVAGLETLSQRYGGYVPVWTDWDESKTLDKTFVDIGITGEDADRIRQQLMKGRHLKLRQTFAGYIADHLPDSFWDVELQDFLPTYDMSPAGEAAFHGLEASARTPISSFVPRDRSVLRKRVLASYDARSVFVHAGARRVDELSTMVAMVSDDAPAKQPLEFLAVRRILRALIEVELGARSQDGELPSVKLFHDTERATRATERGR